ncbi:MAG: SMP-30/gluconolactonase/LRE family protein, partial [Nitriliruptorales bacterium]|nr:SMP-30/gluconolactonase/LRE family protein [Nitriliruptorales bacterium]
MLGSLRWRSLLAAWAVLLSGLVAALPAVADVAAVINTYAGGNGAGYEGDGGPAELAQLHHPGNILLDAEDNLFIGDTFNHAVRRVDAETGAITTIAGGNGPGYDGDDALAVDATFEYPVASGWDTDGSLLVGMHHAVRRIDLVTGIVTTVVGGNGAGYDGDGGPAESAKFARRLRGLRGPEGHLWIVDMDNHAIRMVDKDTGIIDTVVGGNGQGYLGDGGAARSAQLDTPNGITWDGDGNLIICDRLNHAIRRVDKDTGIIDTVVGGNGPGYSGDDGPARLAQLNEPVGPFIDAVGNWFIGDRRNHAVRRVDATTGAITTIAGGNGEGDGGDGGDPIDAQFFGPAWMAFRGDGTMLVADREGHAVRSIVLGTATVSVTTAGSGAGTVTSDRGGIDCPAGSCAAELPRHTTVTLTASPAAGSEFEGWSGACTGGEATCTIMLEQAEAVTATFRLLTQPLSVSVLGDGTVTGPELVCNDMCTVDVPQGGSVTLTAEPDPDLTFLGWAGDCAGAGSTCTVTLDQPRSVTANFEELRPAVNLDLRGSGAGVVSWDPVVADCAEDCWRRFDRGSKVTLVATPAAGSYVS